MAAKLNKRTAEQTRSHIQAVLLLKRLQEYALADLQKDNSTDMSPQQVSAAKFLIEQAIGKAPQEQSIDLTGESKLIIQEPPK